MHVRIPLTCACWLLGGCLLGDADGEAPPPASLGASAPAITFNPAAMVAEGDRSNGPLLLPRNLEQPPEEELTEDYVFDEEAYFSGDFPIQDARIDGMLGARQFAGPTDQNYGWYTSWEFDGVTESYMTLEVASDGDAGAGMLIVSFEGDLAPLREQLLTMTERPETVTASVSTWVVACYGASMYNWDADLPAEEATVSLSADPDDPDAVVFDVSARFDPDQRAPVSGTIWAARGDLEALLGAGPQD